MQQNYINHVVLVLDASSSMQNLGSTVVKVADNQIKYLANRSRELDQETRVTVYSFSDTVKCLIYDKDVLRLPSISNLYKLGGMTALIDAAVLSQEDLAMTPEKYGEHAFVSYFLTDGQENRSKHNSLYLTNMIKKLPDNRTLVVFVPDQNGVFEAKKFGFPKDNIAVWDTSSSVGLSEVGERIRQTSEIFMTQRTSGVKAYNNLLTLDPSNIKQAVSAGVLQELHHGQFRIFDIDYECPIAQFIEQNTGRPYKIGEAYYELTKRETIQSQKEIAVYDNKKHSIYTGNAARQLLNLPNYEVRVSPTDHPMYSIFVQSTSVNRKLVHGTRLLVMS